MVPPAVSALMVPWLTTALLASPVVTEPLLPWMVIPGPMVSVPTLGDCPRKAATAPELAVAKTIEPVPESDCVPEKFKCPPEPPPFAPPLLASVIVRSEERRVGKEGRARWWPNHYKKYKQV